MERKKASDYPQELLDLFDRYVHGDIPRREFLDGAKKFATGGLTAMAIWESLRPNYAWAEQVPKDDKRIKTGYETVPSPDGNGSIKGYLVRPAGGGKQPGVLVVHENRGLNPYIEDVARRLGTANFVAFAPDGLTSAGGYPGDDEKGAQVFGQVDRAKMSEDFVAAARWLKARPDCTGKSEWWDFVSAEASPISSPCAWDRISQPPFPSTGRSRRRPMSRRSKRRCC
jgi:carboxymethylenebutenolidase